MIAAKLAVEEAAQRIQAAEIELVLHFVPAFRAELRLCGDIPARCRQPRAQPPRFGPDEIEF